MQVRAHRRTLHRCLRAGLRVVVGVAAPRLNCGHEVVSEPSRLVPTAMLPVASTWLSRYVEERAICWRGSCPGISRQATCHSPHALTISPKPGAAGLTRIARRPESCASPDCSRRRCVLDDVIVGRIGATSSSTSLRCLLAALFFVVARGRGTRLNHSLNAWLCFRWRTWLGGQGRKRRTACSLRPSESSADSCSGLIVA